MSLTVTQNNPFKVTGTTAVSDDVTTDRVFLTHVRWVRPTTVGHKLTLTDSAGNELADAYCDVADKDIVIPIYIDVTGVAITDMDSGTVYVFTRPHRIAV